jgi:hypothetical protein
MCLVFKLGVFAFLSRVPFLPFHSDCAEFLGLAEVSPDFLSLFATGTAGDWDGGDFSEDEKDPDDNDAEKDAEKEGHAAAKARARSKLISAIRSAAVGSYAGQEGVLTPV